MWIAGEDAAIAVLQVVVEAFLVANVKAFSAIHADVLLVAGSIALACLPRN
jgi:hypothetical protein